MADEQEFGKDAGLIHEAVVTLRKAAKDCGLDLREWFSRITHDLAFTDQLLRTLV